jgi:ubiquinone/menaquinone biosynthesis C-methylase UbiE
MLACPRCHEQLELSAWGEGDLDCARCGTVGQWRLGCADFLAGESELRGALNARLDLEHDAAVAAKVAERAPGMEYRALSDYGNALLQNEPVGEPDTSTIRGRAQKRYERWYHCVACEVGDDAGDGTVERVEASLRSRGLPPLGKRLAVEAGSGVGRHLPGLARHFDLVVCVDCSLTNLVLAREFAERAGTANVVFVRADVERLPLASESADLVHQNGVIEHVADPQAMVDESLRVTRSEGSYACISPNRYPITPEAHFKLPLFGLFPRSLRALLLPIVRGVDSEVGTDLRSLRELDSYFATAGATRAHTFFVSPATRGTVRQTRLRQAIVRGLDAPLLGRLLDLVLNRLLLPIAPYQVVVASKDRRAERSSPSSGWNA